MRVDQMELQWVSAVEGCLLRGFLTDSPQQQTVLNRQPSTADTHNIMDNSESSDCPYIHFNKQPLKSGYPATLYNQQFLSSQLNANNPI